MKLRSHFERWGTCKITVQEAVSQSQLWTMTFSVLEHPTIHQIHDTRAVKIDELCQNAPSNGAAKGSLQMKQLKTSERWPGQVNRTTEIHSRCFLIPNSLPPSCFPHISYHVSSLLHFAPEITNPTWGLAVWANLFVCTLPAVTAGRQFPHQDSFAKTQAETTKCWATLSHWQCDWACTLRFHVTTRWCRVCRRTSVRG